MYTGSVIAKAWAISWEYFNAHSSFNQLLKYIEANQTTGENARFIRIKSLD